MGFVPGEESRGMRACECVRACVSVYERESKCESASLRLVWRL
jgi:hypothetical protein